jgi:hypothetical protein
MVLVVLGCGAITGVVLADDTLRVIAATGEPIPGWDAGWVFGDVIDFAYGVEFHGRDHLSFQAGASNAALGANFNGLWEYNQGTYALLAYSDMPFPDGSALEFNFGSSVGAPGMFAVGSYIGPDATVWSNRSGVLERVMGVGDSIAELGGDIVRTSGVGLGGLSESGTMVLGARMSDLGAPPNQNYWAIFSDLSGTMTPILTQHDAVPGLPGGVFSNTSSITGNVARNGIQFLTPGVVTDIDEDDPALIAYDGHTLQTIAAPGMPVQGDIPGLEFWRPFVGIDGDWNWPAYSDVGHAAFMAYLKVPGVDPENDPIAQQLLGVSVWRWHEGELELVLRGGQTPTGYSEPILFATEGVAINNLGQIAFGGLFAEADDFSGAFDSALWSDRSGTLEILLRRNDVTLTSVGNVKFDGFWNDGPIAINDLGQIAFTASFSLVDTAGGGQGYFVLNPDGTVELLATTRQSIDLPSGGTVEIPGLSYLGAPIPFNEQGQAVLFGTNYLGKSALLVSDAALVPEPSSLVLAALGGLGMLAMIGQRRRTARTTR